MRSGRIRISRVISGTSTKPSTCARRAFLAAKSAYELLLAGDSRGAAESFQKAKDAALAHPDEFDANFLPVIRGYLAVSYLRMGEQANCCSMYGPRSCLLPIEGSGVHQQQEGSRAAIREYLELLEANPGDTTARWLLNVAFMTVGEHPEKVPPQWLIPPEKFAPTGAMPRFENIAPASISVRPRSLAVSSWTTSTATDFLICSLARPGSIRSATSSVIFKTSATARLKIAPKPRASRGLTGGMNLLHADYDNDGRLDVLVLRGAGLLGEIGDQPPSLLRNRGDGVFEDVTEAAGLLFFAPTQCGAWGDFDNDGRLDLFVGIESSAIPGFEVPLYQELAPRTDRPSKLFRNLGNGKFVDVAASVGVNVTGYIRGAAWGDVDNDGFPELAVARGYGPALLFPNVAAKGKKSRRFGQRRRSSSRRTVRRLSSSITIRTAGSICSLPATRRSRPIMLAGQVAADLLGQPHTAELPRLYRNNGAAANMPRFRDVTAEAELNHVYFAGGAVADDFDNDGWPDLYLSTGAPDYRAIVPKRMLRNLGDGRFEDVSSSAGIAHLQKGSAVAVGDIDRDGDQDILQVLGGEFPGDIFPRALFVNPGNGNRSFSLQLAGSSTNRSALGARVSVELETPGGPRTVHSVVSSGGSYGGSTLEQEIGVGDATQIKSIQVRWPAGGTQRVSGAALGRRYRLTEGKPELVEITTRPPHGQTRGSKFRTRTGYSQRKASIGSTLAARRAGK